MNFSWDGEQNQDVIIFRLMMFDSPKEVIKTHGLEKLREVFWAYWFRFDKLNLNFWKFVLEIDDEEFKRKTEGSFRKSIQI